MNNQCPEFTIQLLEAPPLVIWCPNKELIPELAIILDQYDIRWGSGDLFNETTARWNRYEGKMCYAIIEGRRLQYADFDFYQRRREIYGPIYEFVGISCFNFVDVEDLL